MATPGNTQLSVKQFNGRLYLAGGRDQGPEGSMRRCVNAAPELTNSVYSRYGSSLAFPDIAAISLTVFNQIVYAYDGSILYFNGANIASGFNGNRLAFAKMAPQIGDSDYLFITGGGRPLKIDKFNDLSNWGILPPAQQITAINVVPATSTDLIVIDTFNTDAANWSPTNASLADEATIVAVINANDSGGSLKINPGSTGAWHIINTFASTVQNFNYYANGDLSLQTDVIQFWFYFDTFGGDTTATNDNQTTWLELDFDVNDGTFKKDFYSIIVGFIPAGATNPVVKKNDNITVRFNTGQWQQVTIAKSQFLRTGQHLQFDWTCVQAMQFQGGNFKGNLYLDYMTQMGGTEMGAGPAVGNGGSEYDYYCTFLNLSTNSESNPQNSPSKVFDVEVNKVQLSNIPLSNDAQVGARKLYRTSAQTVPSPSFPAFYLDTIYDNTTTTYLDSTADFTVPLVITPWQKSVAVPPANIAAAALYYIDAGNGYYFKLTTSGTTGTTPPTWAIPTNVWSAQSLFTTGETTSQFHAGGHFWQVTTQGVSGLIEPNWASAPSPISDGTVVWTDIGIQTTADNTAVWTFMGINSTQVLGNNQLLFDNTPPLASYQDAVGPFQGCMFWCRDSTPGAMGRVYFSPAGRPESVEDFVDISTDDDPTQKLVIWDENLYCLTQQKVYPIVPIVDSQGGTTYTAGDPILGAKGTPYPFSVVSTTAGVIYMGPDGPRYFTNGGNGLIAFDALAPIFRGQQEENYPPFPAPATTVIAAQTRGEILFSDTTTTFGLIRPLDQILAQPVWRNIDQPMRAIYYNDATNIIYASWGISVYDFEDPALGLFADNGVQIPIDWQSPNVLINEGQFALVQRIYIDINTSGQNISPTLLIDENPFGLTLPDVNSTTRTTFEIDFQTPARFVGLRLTRSTRNPSVGGGRVEWFGFSIDLRPTQS